MANPFFSFKQFTVYHDRCAMKVGTDGVLLGAWAYIAGAQSVLDIGTGTGLIALMLAQRDNELQIKAIDIDGDAITQASDNVAKSPFGKQIECKHISLQNFANGSSNKFDLIVSNPPFFVQSLKSPDEQRTFARHTESLPIEELIRISSTLLTDKGRLSLIYPFEHKEMLLDLAKQNGLIVSRITNIYPTPSSSAKRILIEFTRIDSSLTENDLIIENTRHVYSDGFTALVEDFYLKL